MPFIGAEFMPHLDEGALWIRATMPYTISFEEASKLGPQMRSMLLELSRRSRPSPTSSGGPTTAPIRSGSSTTSISSGSSRTTTPRGSGAIRTKAQLIDAIQEKLAAFPGIIFNYTQPAEDAVDEAETGLKSSLAVKIFGTDLETLETKAEAVQTRHLAACPASRTSRWCASSASRA